ncbi:sigma-70 family RNA polymerase sigma factor [Cohnella caldifontis]|uniref:sigma-70 family RNA polymerase sigma factor n=1 Tax=Cohnella caldifontis TaxID=3027471 RepID=UPI0023EC0932|nr:sigma-70 family RNA polymerase sigma factor [Cohnella sp. YIM B05605]
MITEQAYTEYKPMLFGLAYRMLGSAADAEDVVQDVFARMLRMEADQVRNEKAYLAKMTVNRSLNLLRSARRLRETYVGPWLPEPLPDHAPDVAKDPAERKEELGYAYLVMLQELTPTERAVFILKESLGFDYREIAGMLGRTETGCRKAFSRAKQKTEGRLPSAAMEVRHAESRERFVEAFLQATDTGRFEPLVALLLNEVRLVSDGGGKVRAALNPIVGADRVRAFFKGLAAKGRFRNGFRRVRIGGETALVMENEGRVEIAVCLEWEPGGSRVQTIYMMLNPDKLRSLTEAAGEHSRSDPEPVPRVNGVNRHQ